MTNQHTDTQLEAFKVWFMAHAKAPIDPWHKEFAWSVWQAAATHYQDALREALDAMIGWDLYTGTLRSSQPKKVEAWLKYNEAIATINNLLGVKA